jgi:hypothetical protein
MRTTRGRRDGAKRDLGEIKGTSVGEVEDSAGGSDDNVRLVVLKSFDALSDVDTPIEDSGFDIRQILRKALVFSLDLEGKLSGVTQDQHVDLSLDRLKQMQCGKDKNSCLSHSRFGLADHIHTKQGLGDALVLNF